MTNDNSNRPDPAAIDQSDLAAYREYADRAIADRDNRTPILAFNEWLSAGRPRGPLRNG